MAKEKCKPCGGKGYERCRSCEGKGKKWHSAILDMSNLSNGKWKTCEDCRGTGKIGCNICNGRGTL